jgi:TP901 family phage tail tape measure protein
VASRKNSIDVFLRLHNQRKFSKEGAAAAATLENLGLRGAKHVASFAATSDKLKSFGQSWTRNVTVPVTIGAALAGKAAMDWESSFAGVRKTVDATEKQYASMEKGLRAMSLQIPVAASDLAGIAEAAGQLGIKRKAIMGFTRTVADLGVATNLAGEEGASTLARFANITQMPQSQFRRLGSTVVALGNAGASTEKDIAAMGLRIAAAGTFAGMSEANVLAIANALSSVGIEAEAGGTAISTAIKTLNSAVVGNTPLLKDFAGIAGMSGQNFARSWKRDAAGTMTSWIEGLARLKAEGKDVPAILYDLGTTLRGTRVQDTLMRAAGAGELLRESISLGNQSWRENTALTEEAEKRYKTVASRLQKLKNRFYDIGITLGQQLLPPLIDLVNFVGPQIATLADAFGSLPGPVKATALGLLILTGPVASGLGYFASGLGKSLVMLAALGRAGKSMQIFTTALAAGQGLSGSAAIAFQGVGKSAALSTVKGFALGLGPPLAALGLANIVMSATESDWKGAGFKAGGALVGGVAGFMVGGPLGAMVGAGLGTVAADFVGGFFEATPKVSRLRQMMDHLRASTVAYRSTLQRLPGIQKRATETSRRHHGAVRAEREASRSLARILARFGPETLPATRAQLRLADAQARVTRTARAQKAAHRLAGNALKLFRMDSLKQVASIKQTIPALRRRVAAMNEEINTGRTGRQFLREVVREEGKLQSAKRELTAVYAQAESKAGKPWASRLENLTTLQARYGTKGRALVDSLRSQRSKLREVTDAGLDQTPMWRDLRSEIKKTREELERFGEATEGLSPPRLTPQTPGEGMNHRPTERTPTTKRGGGKQKATKLNGAPPPPRNATLLNKPMLQLSGLAGEGGTIVIQNVLDGKVISESVAKRAEDEAAYK